MHFNREIIFAGFVKTTIRFIRFWSRPPQKLKLTTYLKPSPTPDCSKTAHSGKHSLHNNGSKHVTQRFFGLFFSIGLRPLSWLLWWLPSTPPPQISCKIKMQLI